VQYTFLGRTGLRVSVAGLGCGGNSRLGLGVGKSEAQAISLVRLAVDLGVNFFDTAEAYGTEEVLGRALVGVSRERVVISSKSRILDPNGKPLPRDTVVSNLEQSLRRLGLERIDVFQLHAVQLKHYDYVLSELVPALQQQRQQGKIAHLGISETPPRDPDQAMLSRALDDSCWEVMMLAFHMLNQGPRARVFPRTLARGIGTLLMFVVRNIFSRANVLRDTIRQLVQNGELPETLQHQSDPLGFLIHEGGASSLTDAAYRFARHEPGADVVLFGTGDQHHLRRNVESLLRPPLPISDCDRLRSVFGRLRGVGLVFPDRSATGIPLQSV
jgi:aryl-alcohol dehydrogenase-like predicted oxidoreductase